MEAVAAWTALVVSLTGLLGSVAVLVKVLKGIDNVHKIVNSNNERLEMKVTDLTRLLTESLEREARRDGAEQERQSPS